MTTDGFEASNPELSVHDFREDAHSDTGHRSYYGVDGDPYAAEVRAMTGTPTPEPTEAATETVAVEAVPDLEADTPPESATDERTTLEGYLGGRALVRATLDAQRARGASDKHRQPMRKVS